MRRRPRESTNSRVAASRGLFFHRMALERSRKIPINSASRPGGFAAQLCSAALRRGSAARLCSVAPQHGSAAQLCGVALLGERAGLSGVLVERQQAYAESARCTQWGSEMNRFSTSDPRSRPRNLSIFDKLAVIAPLVLLACDPSSLSTGPSDICTESGARCQLSKGPLGVCERSQCAPGETPPCFQCTPQH